VNDVMIGYLQAGCTASGTHAVRDADEAFFVLYEQAGYSLGAPGFAMAGPPHPPQRVVGAIRVLSACGR
jgi:hypothetical protein